MKGLTSLLILVVFLFSPLTAFAEKQRFYVSGSLGYSFNNERGLEDKNIQQERAYNEDTTPYVTPEPDPANPDAPVAPPFLTSTLNREFQDINLKFDGTIFGVAAAGIHFKDGLRLEFEYSYRSLDLDSFEGKDVENYFVNQPGCSPDRISTQIICTPEHNATLRAGALLQPLKIQNEIQGEGENAVEIEGGDGLTVHSFMGNVFKDFVLTKRLKFYVGAGLGVARMKQDIRFNSSPAIILDDQGNPDPDAPQVAPVVVVVDPATGECFEDMGRSSCQSDLVSDESYVPDSETWNFAYQGMVGLSFNLTKSLVLSGGYRYFGADEFESHGIETGLRIYF